MPKDLKSAKNYPNLKENSKTEAGNDGPVSILSIVSKVLEKVG